MSKILIILFFVLAGGWTVTQLEKITAISIETYTRGYRKTIIIRPDSTFIREQNQPGSAIKRKTNKAEWASLLKSIAGYKLTELTNLPAPTNNRARDAALTANITIQTNQKTYQSGAFDDGQPHPKLAKLTKTINQMAAVKP